MEKRLLKHKVRWSEDDSTLEGVVGFNGLPIDIEKQLNNNELNYVYETKAREAWQDSIIKKAFSNRKTEIKKAKKLLLKEKGEYYHMYSPRLTDVLAYMDLYKMESYRSAFSLKIDGNWKQYKFLEDLDKIVIERELVKNDVVKHRVTWEEDSDVVEGEVSIEGLTPDAYIHLIHGDFLYSIFARRAFIAWENDIMQKVFESRWEEIIQFRDEYEEKSGKKISSTVELLEHMGLYKADHFSDKEFSLKIDDFWKSFRFLRDMDAPIRVI